jgi:hypothetical protein
MGVAGMRAEYLIYFLGNYRSEWVESCDSAQGHARGKILFFRFLVYFFPGLEVRLIQL